jgi:RND family efflux transporter MFP subunit
MLSIAPRPSPKDQSGDIALRWEIVLDLLALLGEQRRFMGVAMALCNETAARFACERTSLGWVRRDRCQLCAMSHTEKFERRMSQVTAIEAAMDEAVHRDEEILFPLPEGDSSDIRDHLALARAQAVGAILSLPIRVDGRPVGVFTLERAAAANAFTPNEVQTLRLLCDLTARRMEELKRHDRWFGARFLTWLREQAGQILGPEHTLAKVGVIAASIALGILLFGRAEYRPEAPFVLKSDELAQLPAPFDGYLEAVHVRAGDFVKAGTPLLALDTRELILQEAGARAERQRFLAEAQKAEGENNVADMRIAQAGADEAGARFALVQHRLKQATVVAPFDGYVIEGDLRERIAAPLKQGDLLIKVAKIDAMVIELSMPERDIQELAVGQSGAIALASRPQVAFPFRVERIEPAGAVESTGSVFTVRGSLTGPKESWWRPGMSGVARVNVGRRPLIWILTHRTADFLRMKLWW